jgi:hypothetical protein
MDRVASWVPIASTFSVLAPLFLLLRDFKSHSVEIKALAFYLMIGFLFDIVGWYFYTLKNIGAFYYLHNTYDLFEALFIYWFLGKVSPYSQIKILFLRLWIVLVPLWSLRFYYPEWMGWFKTLTQLIIAFVSCFFILRLVEKTNDISRNLVVWILLGMFFYCFCTYFILGTLVFIVAKTWISQNFVNITTNIIYCIGLLRAKNAISIKT